MAGRMPKPGFLHEQSKVTLQVTPPLQPNERATLTHANGLELHVRSPTILEIVNPTQQGLPYLLVFSNQTIDEGVSLVGQVVDFVRRQFRKEPHDPR
jgi:hypothetical protein